MILSRYDRCYAMGRKIYWELEKGNSVYHIDPYTNYTNSIYPARAGLGLSSYFHSSARNFSELIMGPTAPSFIENEPMEKKRNDPKTKAVSNTFFSLSELGLSIVQDLPLHWAYSSSISMPFKILTANDNRTMVFTTLITANIFLISQPIFYYSIITTTDTRTT